MSERMSGCCPAGTLEPADDKTAGQGFPTPSNGIGIRDGDGIRSRVTRDCEPSIDKSCPIDMLVEKIRRFKILICNIEIWL
jgi:hypothetical protein